MSNLQSSIWLDDAFVRDNEEVQLFWDFGPDAEGWLFEAQAFPRNARQNEGDEISGGAVEITSLYWLRKGQEIAGFTNLQLNIRFRGVPGASTLGGTFFSVYMAWISPAP